MTDVEEFLKSQGMGKEEAKPQAGPSEPLADNPWDKIIVPNMSCLLTGDVGTGKSGLAYWLLETQGKKYGMAAATVGIPKDKRALLPDFIEPLDKPADLAKRENCIVFIDEADLQLPMDDTRQRGMVTEFLSLPRQRRQILILGFHYPRLVLSRYLPYFQLLLFKRPPYLLEFAGKSKNDSLVKMMAKAEERFAELVPPNWEPDDDHPQPLAVLKNTYVIAPRLRWQGMVENPVPSFWSPDLSKVWAGASSHEPASGPIASGFVPGVIATDAHTPITERMWARRVKVEDIPGTNQARWLDPGTNIEWIS